MTAVELFSGCGGLAKGLENAGFQHLAFVEFNKWACSSLRLNFPGELVHETDIRQFNFSVFPSIDLVAGGPPCQPFSLGGLAKAYNDQRDMFPQAARAICELRPKAFLFENVKGLLRQSFSSYFNYILDRLTFPDVLKFDHETWQAHADRLHRLSYSTWSGLKYRVNFKLLNAADFGVPQIRERVFIVGIRSDIRGEWTWPTPTVPKNSRRSVGSVIRMLPDPQSDHRIADHIFIGGARTYPGHTGSDIDFPSKTIKAGAHGVPGGENMIRFNDGTVRYMTIHEAKLIQTFPPDYKIAGSWGEALRQIGNAVPVKLATVLGKRLAAVVNSSYRIPPHSHTINFTQQERANRQLLFDFPCESQSLYLIHASPVTLLGTYRKKCCEWIVSKNLYNYPVTDEEIENHSELLSVRRLILMRKNDKPLYFAIRGYSIVTKGTLEKFGYPGNKKHAAKTQYLLYKLQPISDTPPVINPAESRLLLGKGVERR